MKVYSRLRRSCSFGLIIGMLVTVDGMAQLSPPKDGPIITTEPQSIGQDTVTKRQEVVLIDLLDNSLQTLADKDRQGRMIGGYVLLGLGAGSVVGGAVTLAVGEGDDARIVGYSLLGGGVLLGGLSLLPFKLKSESEHLYAEFRREFEQDVDRNPQEYYYWDRRFEALAEKSKQQRIIGGVTSIVAGGVTSLALVEGSGREQFHAFLWPAIGGVTSLLVKSDTERQYETYSRAREDIISRRTVSEVHFGIMPLPRGGIVSTVQLRF